MGLNFTNQSQSSRLFISITKLVLCEILTGGLLARTNACDINSGVLVKDTSARVKRAMYKLLLSPAGRLGRQRFWLGMAVFALLVVMFNWGLRQLGGSVWAFLISLPFPFLALHMAYSLYGKRLHDMGRSFWPLTAMLVLAFIVIPILVILSFGGSEFFADFAQYERKANIDPEVGKALQDQYQQELKEGVPYLPHFIWAIIGAFTLWCGLSKPEAKTNRYGVPLV